MVKRSDGSRKSFSAPFSKGAIAPLLKRQFRTRAWGIVNSEMGASRLREGQN